MFPKISGNPLNITCTEQSIPEFPELLFGTTIEKGKVFDATLYLQKKNNSSLKIEDFFKQFDFQINSLVQAYSIKENEICFINKEGHLLIDDSLTYLFISFVEPSFCAYICERIHELFTQGVCISDSSILNLAKNRLSSEMLAKIIDNG